MEELYDELLVQYSDMMDAPKQTLETDHIPYAVEGS